MHLISTFFFRLFFAFLAAKLLAGILGLAGVNSLLGLTFLLLANIYLFDYLDYRSRTAWRRGRRSRETGPAPEIPPPPPD